MEEMDERKKTGRKEKYDSEVKPHLLKISAWARDGLVDLDIAKNLDICEATFYKYKREKPEFAEALRVGKEEADILVENAMFKKAIGYAYDEVTYEKQGDELVEVKRVKKEAAPDTTAQIFWLKNRKSADWRDKRHEEVEITAAPVKLEDYFIKGERSNRIEELLEKANPGGGSGTPNLDW